MKKISSEIKVDAPSINAKWGTIDKKNPSSIYLEIGAYITPKIDCDDYSSKIREIEKAGKSIVKAAISETDGIKNDFIFVPDIADTRISYGKKSYISFQIHLGRSRVANIDKSFKDIVVFMDSKWKPVYSGIVSAIENNGFSCSKTRN